MNGNMKIKFQTGEIYDIIGERPQLWIFRRTDGTIGKISKGMGTFEIYDVEERSVLNKSDTVKADITADMINPLSTPDLSEIEVVDHTFDLFDLEDSDETA